MGYEHYWSRPPILDPIRFAIWSCDVGKVISALPANMIRGPSGDGEPIITPTVVEFNGNGATYVWRDAWLQNDDPWRTDAGMHFTVEQSHVDSSRTWLIPDDDRPGWLNDACKTRQKSYDIAVAAALILLAHHFPRECRVSSDGELVDWQQGLVYAEHATGLSLGIPIYSHRLAAFFPLLPDCFARWSNDVTKLIAMTDIPLAGPDGTGKPIITPMIVAFNGVGDDGYDPFYLPRGSVPEWQGYRSGGWIMPHYRPGNYLEYQTMGSAGKRYDAVVMAALILFLLDFPRMGMVYSKGDTEAWLAGRDLLSAAMGVTTDVSVNYDHRVLITL